MQIHPSSSILRLACRLACCILPIAGGSAWTAAEASGAPGPDAAVAPAIQILFGTVGQTESTEASGERKAQSTAESSNFAAFLNEAGTTGTLIGYIASIGQGFAVNIALVDNNFVAITNALGPGNVQGQTLTLDGSLSDGTLSGTIEELNLPFSASVESATGTTASISGLYEAEVPGGNGIFSIVGTQGDIFVLAMTPTDVSAGPGSIDAEGAFDLNTSLGTAATVAGTIDPSTTVITGTITPDESGGGGGGSGGGGGGGSGGGGGGGGGTPINFTGSSPSSPPAVVPAAQTVAAGASPKLIVTGSGTVQWQLNGVNISGATDSMLKLPDIGTDQAGTYTAVVTGSDDSVTSLSGTVAVTVSAHLANLSARGYVESGSDQLVVGYVVSGSGPKQILVRGDGPALINFYITDPLEAPELTLYDDKAAVISTDIGWSNPLMAGPSMSAAAVQPATAAIMKQVYAFPLVADSADCAMLATVPPAAYTASVTSADGGTGIALAELYDADTGTPASHLINISARALAGTGSQVLVAGFVISGSSSETVLIRGIGPALGPPPFNIAGYLATPTLTLYDSSNKVIATNVGWGNAPGTGTSTVAAGVETATAAVMKDVGAFSLPSNSADCAMTVTLPPGDYTAQVSGAGSASGIALAEIYDVP